MRIRTAVMIFAAVATMSASCGSHEAQSPGPRSIEPRSAVSTVSVDGPAEGPPAVTGADMKQAGAERFVLAELSVGIPNMCEPEAASDGSAAWTCTDHSGATGKVTIERSQTSGRTAAETLRQVGVHQEPEALLVPGASDAAIVMASEQDRQVWTIAVVRADSDYVATYSAEPHAWGSLGFTPSVTSMKCPR